MAKLKPCPFCGGSNIVIDACSISTTDDGYFNEDYRVACQDCGGGITRLFPGRFSRENGEFVFMWDGYAAAAAAWSSRADRAASTDFLSDTQ